MQLVFSLVQDNTAIRPIAMHYRRIACMERSKDSDSDVDSGHVLWLRDACCMEWGMACLVHTHDHCHYAVFSERMYCISLCLFLTFLSLVLFSIWWFYRPWGVIAGQMWFSGYISECYWTNWYFSTRPVRPLWLARTSNVGVVDVDMYLTN